MQDIFGNTIEEVIPEPDYKRKRLSPFDFAKDLSQYKRNLLKQDPEHEKDLKGNVFMINRAFSYHIDTILWANEINQFPGVDPVLLHDFYFYGLPSKPRYAKWSKVAKDDDINLIMEHYGYSKPRAVEALDLLTPDDIMDIMKMRETGGRK